jgi:hypothetical protein
MPRLSRHIDAFVAVVLVDGPARSGCWELQQRSILFATVSVPVFLSFIIARRRQRQRGDGLVASTGPEAIGTCRTTILQEDSFERNRQGSFHER